MAQKKKNQTKISGKSKAERLTNQYMIQLSFGVLGVLLLLLLLKGYGSPQMVLKMQTITWVLFGIFALATVLLLVLGKTGVIKNKTRAYNYAILTGVSALVSLWLSLYNKLNSLLWDMNITIHSNWRIYLPMIAIGVYLLIALVVLVVRVSKK